LCHHFSFLAKVRIVVPVHKNDPSSKSWMFTRLHLAA